MIAENTSAVLEVTFEHKMPLCYLHFLYDSAYIETKQQQHQHINNGKKSQ